MKAKIKINADELDKLGEKIKEKLKQHLASHKVDFEISISGLHKIKFSEKILTSFPDINKIKCPKCGGPINWMKPIGNYNNDGIINLLIECWSGNIDKEKPRHTSIIKVKIEGSEFGR